MSKVQNDRIFSEPDRKTAPGGKIQDALTRGKDVRRGEMLATVHQAGAALDPLRDGKRTGTNGGSHCRAL